MCVRKVIPLVHDEWKFAKSNFFRVRDRFGRAPSDVNRVMMSNARSHFKSPVKISRKKQHIYDKSQTQKLLEVRFKNVKLYWKMLSYKNKSRPPFPISTGDWYNHFLRLSNPDGAFFVADADVSDEVKTIIENDISDVFHELNLPITTEDI